ncbi:MAG TPA: NADH-quinone oxidoreductase subunit N [Longimicrobiales bacterium]
MTLDFTNQIDYLWALLPEVVLSVWAMLVLLVDVFQKGDRSEPSRPAVAWLTLAGIGVAAVANGWLLTLREAAPTGMIAVDAFRVFTNYLFLLAAALFVLISTRYLERERMQHGELYVLVLLASVGMMVFAGARDLMVIFLGLELMSVAVYVLTGANRRDRRAGEAALKYFLLGAFSSAFFLFGIALIYGATRSTSLPEIGAAIGVDGLGASGLALGGMALLMVGFGFKIAAVPFHMWTPDAYDGAPAPVSGFMATAVKAAAFAAFLRVFLTAFPGLYESWGQVVIWLAVLTMAAANLVALAQGNVKRMLAYSSIAHAGYLLVALAAASTIGAASFLFYLVVYTLMTVGAFAVVLAVARQGERELDLEAYSGLGWERPILGITMTVFLLSLAGFPFTGGFIGKFYILRAAVEEGLVPLAVVLVLASLVSYYYYLRVAWYMWFREAPSAQAHGGIEISPGLRFALVAAVVGIVWLGIFPGQLLELAERSAAIFGQMPSAFLGLGGP